MKPDWTSADIPDLRGKVAIVTGANIGLGYEIAKRLAENNAEVIMACRNMAKADAARIQLLSELDNSAQVETMQLDISSMDSVRQFAEAFQARYNRLDIIMCNAGVMAFADRRESADGFELQFATNHLGHFLLVGLLMALLERTEGSRVVTQSSAANWFGSFEWDNLNAEKSYSKWPQYGMTKLANVAFVNELNGKVKDAGKEHPKAFSVHPGFVVGQLQAVSAEGFVFEKMMYRIMGMMAGTYETGALPALYACVNRDAKIGEFYGPNGFYGGICSGDYPKVVPANNTAINPEAIKKLWEVSEEFTQFKYDFSA